MRRWLAVLWLLVAGPALADESPRLVVGDSYALIVGNNEYAKLPRLRTAVSDASAVAELLRARYAFKEVKLVINATRDTLLGELNRLRATLTEQDHLLIYYAGHGVLDQATDEGYWLPVDADPESDVNWIPNGRISAYLRAMSARHVLVVADSCYSGALVRAARTDTRAGGERRAWLARMAEKRGRTALTSGGLEPVLDGGRGGHSVFATALLDALRENTELIDGQSLYQAIRTRVVVNAAQTPAYSDVRNAFHEGGDFIFVPAAVASAAVVQPPAATPAGPNRQALDLAFWNSVKDSANPAALQAYLDEFPDGTFAALARVRLAELTRKAKPAEPKPAPQVAMVPPPKPVAPALTPVEATFVALKNANVRAAPSAASERVTTLPAGTEVYVAGRTQAGDWLAVERDGKPLGYVYAPLMQDKAARDAEMAARQPVQPDAVPSKPEAPAQAALQRAPPSPPADPLTGTYAIRIRTSAIHGVPCAANASLDIREQVDVVDGVFELATYANGARIDLESVPDGAGGLRFSGTMPGAQELRPIIGAARPRPEGYAGTLEVGDERWCGAMELTVELERARP